MQVLSFFFEFSSLTQFATRPSALKRRAELDGPAFAQRCWSQRMALLSRVVRNHSSSMFGHYVGPSSIMNSALPHAKHVSSRHQSQNTDGFFQKPCGATLSVQSGVQEISKDSSFEAWSSILFLEQQKTQVAVFSDMALRSWGVSNHNISSWYMPNRRPRGSSHKIQIAVFSRSLGVPHCLWNQVSRKSTKTVLSKPGCPLFCQRLPQITDRRFLQHGVLEPGCQKS